METMTMVAAEVAGDVVGSFGQFLGLKGRAVNTVAGYVQDVGVYASWVEGRYGEGFDLAMVNRTDLQGFWRDQVEVARVSAATWNRRRAALRVFARWAQDAGLLSYDPTDGLPAAEAVELAPRWLDGREMGRLERAMERGIQGARTEAARVKMVRDRCILLLLAKCGLREGELCALDLADLDLGERKGRLAVRFSKGNKSRVVPVNSQALGALRAWLEVRPVGGEAVFVGKGGVRLQERGVQRLAAELGRQAGIMDLTPHRLRHTCGKALVDAGVQLTVVAKLLGHSRLDTTMRYTTPSEQDLAAAVSRI